MRNAAGDVGPRGGALSGHKVADVVKRDDAGAIIASRISGDANVENALAAVPEHGRLPLMKPEPERASLFPNGCNARLDGVERPADEAEVAAEQPIGGRVRNRDDAIMVDAKNACRDPRQHRLNERAPLVVERVRFNEASLLTQDLGGHLVERVPEMAEVSILTARRHLNMKVAGSDLVRGADQASDRPDQPIGEGEAQPDGGKQHRQRQEHEDGGEAQFKTVPMGLEASPYVGDERGVFSDLGRQGVNSSRSVQELPVGARDGPNADEDVADAEEAAERLAVYGVLKVGRLRSGDQLRVRPLRDNDRSAVVPHDRGGGKA